MDAWLVAAVDAELAEVDIHGARHRGQGRERVAHAIAEVVDAIVKLLRMRVHHGQAVGQRL